MDTNSDDGMKGGRKSDSKKSRKLYLDLEAIKSRDPEASGEGDRYWYAYITGELRSYVELLADAIEKEDLALSQERIDFLKRKGILKEKEV